MELISPALSTRYWLYTSGDSPAAVTGQAGVGIVLSTTAAAALIDWIPVNSRLCVVRLAGSVRTWSQIDHIAVSYRRWGSIQDCRSYWSTYLDSDHALITQAIREAGTAACDRGVHGMNKHWISEKSLELLEARRNIPPGSSYNKCRRDVRRKLKRSLKADREAWLLGKVKEMETAFASENTGELFKLTVPLVSGDRLSPVIVDQLYREQSAVFQEGLGSCTKTDAVFHHFPNARPVFQVKHPVPHAAVPLVDNELDRPRELGALKSISHSAWTAPIAAVNGDKFLAKLDLRDAYLRMEISESLTYLLIINISSGPLQCQRLPVGVKTVPTLSQQTMRMMLTDVPDAPA
ncbi:uncharacterized protein DEA37_0005760 [Paragonimus westermani]|uniref:Reverse transcriptase domain-containing protein n=1 Tax=Paragonimus westermani TaxID=34504 RepID=A0A5J4NTP1_9TREM|nr:uncharacterized protein DEA37_0005760 [Paragonimus westermani]